MKPWVADFFFVQFYKYPGIIEGILLRIKGEDLDLSFKKDPWKGSFSLRRDFLANIPQSHCSFIKKGKENEEKRPPRGPNKKRARQRATLAPMGLLSPLRRLTSVFGMVTGVTAAPLPPDSFFPRPLATGHCSTRPSRVPRKLAPDSAYSDPDESGI